MRIIAFPHLGIAYNNVFYSEIQKQGVKVITGNFSGRWLLNNLMEGDIVHIHWPSFLYFSRGSYLKVLLSFFRFLIFLTIIRLKGQKCFWTAHNLLPHGRCVIPFLDIIARHIIIELSSQIFVHGGESERLLIKRFPRSKKKCVRIPHGNWIESYKPVQSSESARIALELPRDKFIYLLFGQCNRYKNIESLIRVFLREAGAKEYLVIAGRFSDKEYLSSIEAIVNGDPKIRIDAKFIPDEEVSIYLSASDAMCVPYHEILTSGTAMLSLGFGKPVISIDRGYQREIINSQTGILVQADNDKELARAMREVREKSWSSEEIINHAKCFSFHDAAAIFLSKIEENK